MELRLAVDVAEQAAGLHGRGPAFGVLDSAEPGHVDRQSTVGERGAADVVAAAANRQRQAMIAREADGLDHVGGAGGADDDGRPCRPSRSRRG